MTTSLPDTISTSDEATKAGIDPRGPRFGAAITATLLLVVVFCGVLGQASAAAFAVGLWLLAALAILFAWGAFAGIRRHPFGRLYARFVRPRLNPPGQLEDPAAPTFAQGVGLIVTAIGLLLALLGLPVAVPIAAAAAFLAAFLNAVFGYCLGCEIYLLLVRSHIIRPS